MTVSGDCRHRFEPLFDIHPVTGASIEVFYADWLATFGRGGAGWFWWSRRRGLLARWLAYRAVRYERIGTRWLRRGSLQSDQGSYATLLEP
jgi:hypothetical protein